MAEDTELVVFGSQAILGQYPEAPPDLRASIEVDVQPLNHPERVDQIDGALGELSQFHATHGFYVHGVSLEAATLPRGLGRAHGGGGTPRGNAWEHRALFRSA